MIQVEWTNIKNGLPDVDTTDDDYESAEVIATDGDKVRILEYVREVVRCWKQYRWEYEGGIPYDGNPIIAWMPLPEPPDYVGMVEVGKVENKWQNLLEL